MKFLKRLFKSRPDVQNIFTEMGNEPISQKLIEPKFSKESIFYSISIDRKFSTVNELMDLATDPSLGSQQLIYLAQLASDKIATINDCKVEISWQQLYDLLVDSEHEDSLYLLSLPQTDYSVPILSESGTVADQFFRLRIDGWRDLSGRLVGSRKYIGAAFIDGSSPTLQTKEVWHLIDFISRHDGFEDR